MFSEHHPSQSIWRNRYVVSVVVTCIFCLMCEFSTVQASSVAAVILTNEKRSKSTMPAAASPQLKEIGNGVDQAIKQHELKAGDRSWIYTVASNYPNTSTALMLFFVAISVALILKVAAKRSSKLKHQ